MLASFRVCVLVYVSGKVVEVSWTLRMRVIPHGLVNLLCCLLFDHPAHPHKDLRYLTVTPAPAWLRAVLVFALCPTRIQIE